MAQTPDSASRRRFLVAAGVATVALGAPVSWYRWKSTRPSPHVPGPPEDSPYDVTVFTTLTEFVSVYFDTRFVDADVVELARRMAYAVQHDSGWREPYRRLADLLDLTSRDLGAGSFVAAGPDTRLDAIRDLMVGESANRELRIRAFFSEQAGQTLHARQATIPHLRRLYQNSGIPWRHRGYSTWPGVSGDPRAYTRAPGQGDC
jgi:hypothetical protein